MVRGHVDIGNLFDLRPKSTYFGVGATVIKFDDTWGDDTFGKLRRLDYANFGAEGAYSFPDKICLLEDWFHKKLETRFPFRRTHGACVTTRLGDSLHDN